MTSDDRFTGDDIEEEFSVDELLDIKPTRHARTILFLIESQTAKLAKESQQSAMSYPPAIRNSGMAYLRAFTYVGGAEPTIQELEEYSEDWAYLVENNVALQATLAYLMAEKYDLIWERIPSIRGVLGLDGATVQEKYQAFYDVALETIYTPDAASLAWFLSRISKRLENIPTFWATFFLTLPVGSGLLALPIAMARIGVIPSIVLLIVFGLLNMFTAAAIAESFARTGEGRYGFAFIGRLVEYYLGRSSSVFLTIVLAIELFLVLIVFYLGIATTLAAWTGLSAVIWVILVFAVGAFFLSRGSFNATIASSIVIAIFNIALIILISVLSLRNIKIPRLTMTALPIGENFDIGIIELIFGIMLAVFSNHLLVANYAKVALRRDPSSRSFIQGSMASIAVTIVLSSLWLISINGAVESEILANEVGTALVPLAEIVGNLGNVLGSIFIISSLGLASVHVSFGLYFTVQERLEQFTDIGGLKTVLGNQFGRFVLGMLPIIIAMLLTIYFVQTRTVSFSVLLSFLGVVGLSLFAGIYPIQLIASSRRRGNVAPSIVYGFLGNPLLLGGAYLMFISTIFVHGLFIWSDPIQRVAAIIIGILVIITTYTAYRNGAFRPRMVVEVRKLDDDRAIVALIADGKPAIGDVLLNYGEGEQSYRNVDEVEIRLIGLRTIHIAFDATDMYDLQIWVHHLLPDNSSIGQIAKLQLSSSNKSAKIQGQLIVPVEQAHYDLSIQLL